MTSLTVYSDSNPAKVFIDTEKTETIARTLSAVGIDFERWTADAVLGSDASSEDILSAYESEIARLKAERGYNTVDVIRIAPDNPAKDAMRAKFIEEHIHDEDEVRFFVEGSGAFYLHIDDKVYRVVGTAGDLLSVPAGTLHWFDMGPEPFFTVIRLFISADGWVAKFTGNPISQTVPRYNEAV
ncbi:MAG: cupin domain-containing protein [Beijerinckiaceae bacterium]|nr:cupin domain-containing protein [Beijerinckiaceae bacterium]